MDASRKLTVPPPEKHQGGSVTLYVSPHCQDKVNRDDLLRLPAILEALPGGSSRLPGRKTWWAWEPSWHPGPGLMVRQYAHGGLWGRLTRTLFLGGRRMRHEFALALYARIAGVPTSAPVALRIERAWGPFVTALYVSERIPGTANLLELCRSADLAERLTSPQRRRLASAIAGAIGAMHDAGIVHADLNLRNILVRDPFGQPEAFVVDFDKAKIVERPSLNRRMANLTRLDRSIVKWAASRRAVRAADRLRFLRAYLQRYPQWAGQWEQIARRYARRHLRHRMFREPDRAPAVPVPPISPAPEDDDPWKK
jgi:tRNA A-37 threonylcarbamoyl transferase component Bud32